LPTTRKLFVNTMAPGSGCATDPGQIVRALQRRDGHECGAFAGNMATVVTDKHPQEKPGFSRIHGPPLFER
jgi:hypothetical protein